MDDKTESAQPGGGQGFSLPKAEEHIGEFWKTNRIFEKTVALRKSQHKKQFVFYEGPPYANGRPGIHHVLARVVKDVILRYKTMRGYFVPRRAGWDTHGLPVEMAAEKALGLKSKKDIEKFGIEKFNEEAKKAVWLYKDDWEKMTERIGYWLDLKNAYVSYAPEYIESIWWTIGEIWRRGLLYKGHKVVPWCPRCGTALSSHELAQGYKETTDESVYVKFKLTEQSTKHLTLGDKPVYVLSWTTTPWTLPGNVALAVNEDIKYAMVLNEEKTEVFVIAFELLTKLFSHSDIVLYAGKIQNLIGKDLIGLAYEPLFNIPVLQNEKSYKIYAADFVTTTDGTGVVHTAVMYGEDDYELGKKIGLPQHHTVDEEGKFTKDVPELAGLPVKSKETEEKIFEHLERGGNLLRKEKYTHEYPYCWRCETALLYYARTSWFIVMSRLRKELLQANKGINWIPEHVKEGRFGEWLREVKDWNLSRERYWGAPLPIWECTQCKHVQVIGGFQELEKYAAPPKNHYWMMRHGEAENNVFNVIAPGVHGFPLTSRGREEAEESAKKFARSLKKQKIDVIFASDLQRTKETAEIAAVVLGVTDIVFDSKLREIQLGPTLDGCHDSKYHELFPTYESKFENRSEDGESLRDLRARMWQFLEGVEKKYEGKHILIVSHEYPLWMLMHAAEGLTEAQAISDKEHHAKEYFSLAEVRALHLKILPRDHTGLIDPHRPFVDAIHLRCPQCKAQSVRVKEVADVWYDSGAMPFAQDHFPFDEKGSFIFKKKTPEAYPADYISEGMDQTRGWFYTMLAVATALGVEAPYRNVITLGLINDKYGKKMSKSKGNIVEPFEVIGKYGVDAVRWYFYTATPPGEPKNFDEQEILKVSRRLHLILYNSFVFWKTYAAAGASERVSSKNVLDQWILARLAETVETATRELDLYHIREAAFMIEAFVDDLSRWYIRRSRRRLQRPAEPQEFAEASGTLGFVLFETIKLMAPFTPFFSDFLWREFGGTRHAESVHLMDWPVVAEEPRGTELIKAMTEVRQLASLALAKRAEVKIKVRQPLARLSVKYQVSGIKIGNELLDILKEEVNVKEVVFNDHITNEVELETVITPELKEEGIIREFVRMVAELRQTAGLKAKDEIVLMVDVAEPARGIISRNEDAVRRDTGAKTIEYKKSGKFDAEIETELDSASIWVGLRKI